MNKIIKKIWLQIIFEKFNENHNKLDEEQKAYILVSCVQFLKGVFRHFYFYIKVRTKKFLITLY